MFIYRIYRYFQDDFGNLIRHVTLHPDGFSFWLPAPHEPVWAEPHPVFDEWGSDRFKPGVVLELPPGGVLR